MLNSRRTLSALLYTHTAGLPVTSVGFSVSIYKNHRCPGTITPHRVVGMKGSGSTALKGKEIPPSASQKRYFLCSSEIRELYFWVQDALCTPHIPIWGLWKELLSIRWISTYFHISLILYSLQVKGFWVLWENKANHRCFSWGKRCLGSDC